MNQTQFQRAAGISAGLAARWFPHIDAAMKEYGITAPLDQAMFIAQMGHESTRFTRLVENLNYAAENLVPTFGSHRITQQQAAALGRTATQSANQKAIANLVYGGEWGKVHLGNQVAGDGWKYRGRGLKQVDDPLTKEAIYKNIVASFGSREFQRTGNLTFRVGVTGPTQGGAAWYAVPRVAMNLVTAALVAQSAEALRGLNYDKQNWQRLFSASSNITVTLPDGSSFTGPSWQYMVNTVATKTNGAVPVNQGGTGGTDADIARTNLYAAKSGDNEDITLIRGLKGRAQLWTDTDYSTGTLVSYTGTIVGAIVRATTSIVATSTYAASASFGYWIDANSIGSSGPALASTGSQQN